MQSPTRYAQIRSSEPSPALRFPSLAPKLDAVARLSDSQYETLRESLLADTALYPQDMLLGSVVSRSLEVCEAFLTAVGNWSISVASALVRLQVDNVLRCHLIAVTPAPDELLAHLAADKPMSDLPLPEGLVSALPPERRAKKMTHRDRVLVALAAQKLDWIEQTYRVASAWIHHSSAHLLTTYRLTGDRKLFGRVPVDIDQFDETSLTSVVDVMAVSSHTIVRYLEEWTRQKAAARDS